MANGIRVIKIMELLHSGCGDGGGALSPRRGGDGGGASSPRHGGDGGGSSSPGRDGAAPGRTLHQTRYGRFVKISLRFL